METKTKEHPWELFPLKNNFNKTQDVWEDEGTYLSFIKFTYSTSGPHKPISLFIIILSNIPTYFGSIPGSTS